MFAKAIVLSAIAALSLLVTASIGSAVQGDTGNQTWGGCTFRGLSTIVGPPWGNQSATARVGGTCAHTFHVHAYFWGSDSQWHYREAEAYVSGSGFGPGVVFNYWTNSIYGYHYIYSGSPSNRSPVYESHAYP